MTVLRKPPRTAEARWKRARTEVLRRDGIRCVLCGGIASHIHHIYPVHAGGTDSPDNLISLCKMCHRYITQPNPPMNLFARPGEEYMIEGRNKAWESYFQFLRERQVSPESIIKTMPPIDSEILVNLGLISKKTFARATGIPPRLHEFFGYLEKAGWRIRNLSVGPHRYGVIVLEGPEGEKAVIKERGSPSKDTITKDVDRLRKISGSHGPAFLVISNPQSGAVKFLRDHAHGITAYIPCRHVILRINEPNSPAAQELEKFMKQFDVVVKELKEVSAHRRSGIAPRQVYLL
jgi:hypothetical protein